MEPEQDGPIPEDNKIIWPKGRQQQQVRPKFGSNRPPYLMFGRKKKHDNNQNE